MMKITRRRAISMLAGMPVLVGAQRSFARNLLHPNGFAGEQDTNAAGHNTTPALPIASGPFQGTRESLRHWQVDGNSPQQQVPGTNFVDKGPTSTGSPTYPLDVLAAFSSDRKRFLISVVNPTEDVHRLIPSITGVKLRNRGKLYQIAPPSVNSANQAGKEPVVKIVETEQTRFPETLQAPPVSVSLYEFEVENT